MSAQRGAVVGRVLMLLGLAFLAVGGLVRRAHDGFTGSEWLIAVAVVVLAAGVTLWYQARARGRRRAAVAAARPRALLWDGWAGARMTSELLTEGYYETGLNRWFGDAALTMAVDDDGIELWRSGLDRPVVTLPWGSIDSFEAGRTAGGYASRPALLICTHRGARIAVVLARTVEGSWAPASAATTEQRAAALRAVLPQARG